MVNSLNIYWTQDTNNVNTKPISGSSNFTAINNVEINNPSPGVTPESGTASSWAAGIISNICARVITSQTTACKVILRDNAASLTPNFTVASGTTGFFSDTSDTASINNNDLVDYSISSGGSTSVWSVIGSTFNPTGTTITIGNTIAFGANISGVIRFGAPMGIMAPTGTYLSAEANAENVVENAMIASNLSVNIYTNAASNSGSVWVSRHNVASGNQLVIVASNTTGVFQDSSDIDSLAAGDSFDYSFRMGQTSFDQGYIQGQFKSSTGQSFYSCASDTPTAITRANSSSFFGITGDMTTRTATETQCEITTNNAFSFNHLTANVSANSMSSGQNSIVSLRANGANPGAGPTVTIAATTTGVFVDSTDTYGAATTDNVNYLVRPGVSGTSITFKHISIWGSLPTGAVATVYPKALYTANMDSSPMPMIQGNISNLPPMFVT